VSERTQRVLIWWGLSFGIIYGVAFVALLGMVPPPHARLTSVEIAAWYYHHHTKIRLGAMVASWSSAFLVPISVVVAAQIRRQEKPPYLWTMMSVVGGGLMSIFLVLPPLFWGVAAYTPNRAPDVTSLMHELGMLSLTTTDQYYVFPWVAIIVICLLPVAAKHSPFPRWFGYLTAWMLIVDEAGAFAFLTHTGPFAWDGLFVFWIPFGCFPVWLGILAYLLLTNLTRQRLHSAQDPHVTAADCTK
jgi:hypothetical protein